MKKLFIVFAASIFILMLVLTGCESKETNTVNLEEMNAQIETWSEPESFGRNNTYKVEISENGSSWTELEVYNVKNGHQKGDPLITKGGATYFGTPYIASLVTFDFTGTVGIRVTYNNGTLGNGNYVISPASYAAKSIQDSNTVTFTLTQNIDSPRKAVFRPENNWDTECLHIMTNIPENVAAYKINENDDNVFIINEGDEIPLYLPEGKTIYYFKEGMHSLPGGYWVDIDLGSVKTITSFDIMTPQKGEYSLPGGLCFEIQAKSTEEDNFVTIFKSEGEDAVDNFNLTGVSINATARYFRIILNGNFTYTPIGGYRFFNKSLVNEVRLFDSDGVNLAVGKAVKGAGTNYSIVTDNSIYSGTYGNTYAGETFNALSGYTYYLEKGSVVKGSFLSNNAENITICGRGILDGSDLKSEHDLSEGRNGSIHFEYCKDIVIEGITIMNAPMWMVVVNYSENVLVDGINLFGYCTNADGIHFSASKNAVATGCFIRTTDDLFVAYHYGNADGLTFKNSVLWSDGGRVLLLGLANTGNINDVTLENCDIITYQNVWSLDEAGGFVQIIATGGKTISDVYIKDVRIDPVRFPVIAQFLQIRAGNDTYGTGLVDGVTLENVSFAGKYMPKSLISVMVPGGTVKNITFKKVEITGDFVSQSNLSEYFSVDSYISVNIQNG